MDVNFFLIVSVITHLKMWMDEFWQPICYLLFLHRPLWRSFRLSASHHHQTHDSPANLFIPLLLIPQPGLCHPEWGGESLHHCIIWLFFFFSRGNSNITRGVRGTKNSDLKRTVPTYWAWSTSCSWDKGVSRWAEMFWSKELIDVLFKC